MISSSCSSPSERERYRELDEQERGTCRRVDGHHSLARTSGENEQPEDVESSLHDDVLFTLCSAEQKLTKAKVIDARVRKTAWQCVIQLMFTRSSSESLHSFIHCNVFPGSIRRVLSLLFTGDRSSRSITRVYFRRNMYREKKSNDGVGRNV